MPHSPRGPATRHAYPDILAEYEADTTPEAAGRFAALATAYLAATREGAGPVSSALHPARLAECFDEPLPEYGRSLAEVCEQLERDVLPNVNRLMHPMYMGHQVSAPLPAGVWMDSLASALNQSVAVWEMSPAATVIEMRVVRWMCDLAGLGPRAAGTLTSGGTEATFTALLAARAAALPHAWRDGVGTTPPVVLCGEHAHYAVTRAVAELGLGVRNALAVPSRGYRMDPSALESRLADLARAGRPVMAVVATAGSTATGSFDDLQAIGRLCDEHGVWLHVDGAHGASALLSETHRYRVRGIERARSVAWDPHKMMLLPLAVGMLLVREERDLEAAFAQDAPYLFHGDGDTESGGPPQRSWDQGRRSLLCSRRADAVKLWVALQRYGAAGLAALYDHLCHLAGVLHEELRARPDFEVLHEPECNILCFRHLGSGRSDVAALDEHNRLLRERYNRSGRGWITSTVLDGQRVLRTTMMNPRTTPEHVRRLVAGLADEAERG